MKNTLWALLSLSLCGSCLVAQRPASQPAQKAEPAKADQDLLTDQEKNIRAYIELLRSDVKKSKTQILGVVMNLEADEAAKFWPIYKEFETEYADYGNGIVSPILSYASTYDVMTSKVADELATKLLDLEQQRNDLKRKYYTKFKTALDPIVAARFLQVENQLERIIDLQITSELPVVAAPKSQP